MPSSQAATIPRPRRRPAACGAESIPLLDLATSPPAPRAGAVARPALVQRLLDGAGAALAIIVAPPGYGKSTLLAEWAQCDRRPFAWLSLGRHEPAAVSALMSRPGLGASHGLVDLVSALGERHSSFVVVLDDTHVVGPPVLRSVIAEAMARLPAGSTIALASRCEPPLPLGRLRTHHLLSEIRIGQLAMNPTEADALLRSEGLYLSMPEVRELVQRTEGWPAALYLAALAARDDPDALASFGGRHHLLAEYLRDEVLADLPPDAVRFSVQTSVLDELSGPICDVVLQRRGSGVALQHLARINPLLVPIDPAHHSYQWHTVMRAALAGELNQTEPELEPALRLRASAWYSGRGHTEAAIDQAAAAGDVELTAGLLWQNILAYLPRARNQRVQSWLGCFCGEQIANSAPLSLSASMSSLVAGDADQAHRWRLAARAAMQRQSADGQPPSLQTGLRVIEAMIAHEGVGAMRELSATACEVEPEDSLWRPLCTLLAGVATHLQGDRAAGERALEQSTRLSTHRAPTVGSLALAQRAMIAIELEDWELAAELTDRGTALIAAAGLETDPLSALILAAAAAARSHHGRIDEAKSNVRTSIDLLAELGDFVPWYGAEARILLAHASLWLADVVGARTLLAQASRFARRVPGAEIFSPWFDHAWAYMDTLGEASLAGPSSLTIAELRILRFLPSHRSFREIGAQLGVSANTVKTQAHAVYRKLGAASRSEAIEQAINAGLLG